MLRQRMNHLEYVVNHLQLYSPVIVSFPPDDVQSYVDERHESTETVSLSSAFPLPSVQRNVNADTAVNTHGLWFHKRQVM